MRRSSEAQNFYRVGEVTELQCGFRYLYSIGVANFSKRLSKKPLIVRLALCRSTSGLAAE
jgi:hypothetical protein